MTHYFVFFSFLVTDLDYLCETVAIIEVNMSTRRKILTKAEIQQDTETLFMDNESINSLDYDSVGSIDDSNWKPVR